jgi:hypothetical protein
MSMGRSDFDKPAEQKDPSSNKWWYLTIGVFLLAVVVVMLLRSFDPTVSR